MSLKNNLPEQVAINYVDKYKHKHSHVAMYMFNGSIYIVDEVNEYAEVCRICTLGISRAGLTTRDVMADDNYVRCGLGTTLTITQE